jgi:hypothetical protein
MQIKCTSCGASQNIAHAQNCDFCGNLLPNSSADVINEIIYQDGNSSIVLFKKALEYKLPGDSIRIMYSNIENITQNLNLQEKKLMAKGWITFNYLFAIIATIANVYNNLIPHKILVENIEFSRQTGKAGILMDSEISLGTFIFQIIVFAIIPLLAAKGIKDENKKRIFQNEKLNQANFLCFQIKAVGLKTIKMNSASETQRVFRILKDRIERAKMAQE